MNMVDSALETLDVALSKRGTFRFNRVHLFDVRSFFLTEFSGEPDQSVLIITPIKHSYQESIYFEMNQGNCGTWEAVILLHHTRMFSLSSRLR